MHTCNIDMNVNKQMCKILTVNPINSVFICDIFIAIIMYNALNVLYVNLSLSTNFFILRRRSF